MCIHTPGINEHSGLGSLTISGAQHMDLVHLEDTVTGSCVSGQCVENLHNKMEIEVITDMKSLIFIELLV